MNSANISFPLQPLGASRQALQSAQCNTLCMRLTKNTRGFVISSHNFSLSQKQMNCAKQRYQYSARFIKPTAGFCLDFNF